MAKIARWEARSPSPSQRGGLHWLADVPALSWGAGALLLALTGLCLWLDLTQHRTLPYLRLLGAAPPLFIFGCLMKANAILRPHPRLRRRLRAVSPRSAYPVRATLWRGEEPLGQDDGLAFFEEGALRYEGVQTSFRLYPADASIPEAGLGDGTAMSDLQWRYGDRAAEKAWGFDLRDRPDVRLYFYPLKARGFASIYAPLYRWLTAPSDARGESVLPPLDPLPGYDPTPLVRATQK